MQTIIQHSLDGNIAEKISSNFKVFETHIRHKLTADLEVLRQTYQTDFNDLPAADFAQIKLFISDMDSTIINIESIDEIADFADLKPEVARLTELAMKGKLDFSDALIQRTALLKGLEFEVLEKVYSERLRVNSGGVELLDFFKNKGVKTAVISGGFNYFTQRLAAEIGLDYSRANQLEIKNNRLTGKLIGDIINAKSKADFVLELCRENSLLPNQVMVAGDGANDLEMMKVAGLSVAFRAKPAVRKAANIIIDFGGLDKIMDFFHSNYAA